MKEGLFCFYKLEENLLFQLLAVAHDISPVKTLALLENRVHRIGDRNLMQLAYQGNLLDVIASQEQ